MTNYYKRNFFNHYISDFDKNWCMGLSYSLYPLVKILDFYDKQFLSYRGEVLRELFLSYKGELKPPFKKCIYRSKDIFKI